MITDPQQCLRCKHYKAGIRCAAFPELPGIPPAILDMKFDHRQPHPGDRGIRWEPREPGVKHPMEEDD